MGAETHKLGGRTYVIAPRIINKEAVYAISWTEESGELSSRGVIGGWFPSLATARSAMQAAEIDRLPGAERLLIRALARLWGFSV